MPEVKDPALLQVLNGGAPQQPVQPRGPVIYGAPPAKKQPEPFKPPAGYQGTEGGLTPIPGGPADPSAPGNNQPPSGYRFRPDGSLEPIPGGPEDKTPKADADASAKIQRLMTDIAGIYADSRDNGGWFETGNSGAAMRGTGLTGTAAYDLAEKIKTINSNLSFDELQKMRDNSPTGGAL